MKITSCVLLLLFFLPSILLAQDDSGDGSYSPAQAIGSRFFNSLYLRGSGSADFSFWKPGMRGPTDEQIIDIETEGLQAYSLFAELGSRGLDDGFYKIASFKKDGPFKSTESQDEIYRTNISEIAGIDKIVGEVDLHGILKLMKVSNYLSFIGLRYTYTREQFYGKGTVLQELAYMAEGSEIVYDPDNDRSFILGATPLYPDDQISFKTTFVDQEYSIPLFQYRIGKTRKTFRVGIYRSVWEKPSNNSKDININVIDWFQMAYVTNLPVVFDSGFKTTGLSLGMEDNSPQLSGMHSNFTMRIGLKNEMELASGIDEAYNVKSVQAFSFLYDGCYRLVFGGDRKSANMQLGFNFDFRYFNKTYDRTEEISTSDIDILVKVYAGFAFILQK